MQTSAWKIRFWGNVFILSLGSHPTRTQNPTRRQSRPNSPLQKRSDGEGPGERPTKWRQAATKIPPRSKAARIPLPKSAAMGRGQGRGQRNGGKPPTKFPHAAKPTEFPSPKAQRWGGARGEANEMAASRQQNSPTQQSRKPPLCRRPQTDAAKAKNGRGPTKPRAPARGYP